MKVSQQFLNAQADQVEAALASHKITAFVEGATAHRRHIHYLVRVSHGTSVSRVLALHEEIAMHLGVTRARMTREGSHIKVSVPRPDPQAIFFQEVWDGIARDVPPFTALLGVDDENDTTVLRIPSPNVVHTLISGTTGSGKSSLLSSMITSLALATPPRNLALVLIDPKRRAFKPFERLPHLYQRVFNEPESIASVLDGMVEIMVKRDREGLLPSDGSGRDGEPRIMVFIDELADLMMADKEVAESIGHSLTRLLQRGREAGIHVIAATQKPTAAITGTLGKANFPVRIVGKVMSPEDAKVATGIAKSGAEKLLGMGDFIILMAGGLQSFQGALLKPDTATAIVQQLNEARRYQVRR